MSRAATKAEVRDLLAARTGRMGLSDWLTVLASFCRHPASDGRMFSAVAYDVRGGELVIMNTLDWLTNPRSRVPMRRPPPGLVI